MHLLLVASLLRLLAQNPFGSEGTHIASVPSAGAHRSTPSLLRRRKGVLLRRHMILKAQIPFQNLCQEPAGLLKQDVARMKKGTHEAFFIFLPNLP